MSRCSLTASEVQLTVRLTVQGEPSLVRARTPAAPPSGTWARADSYRQAALNARTKNVQSNVAQPRLPVVGVPARRGRDPSLQSCSRERSHQTARHSRREGRHRPRNRQERAGGSAVDRRSDGPGAHETPGRCRAGHSPDGGRAKGQSAMSTPKPSAKAASWWSYPWPTARTRHPGPRR